MTRCCGPWANMHVDLPSGRDWIPRSAVGSGSSVLRVSEAEAPTLIPSTVQKRCFTQGPLSGLRIR